MILNNIFNIYELKTGKMVLHLEVRGDAHVELLSNEYGTSIYKLNDVTSMVSIDGFMYDKNRAIELMKKEIQHE